MRLIRRSLLVVCLWGASLAQNQHNEQDYTAYFNNLWHQANSYPPGSIERIESFQHILALQPQHLETRMALGMDQVTEEIGVQLLEDCFDATIVSKTLPEKDAMMAFQMANFIGRFRHQRKEYEKASKFFTTAFDLSLQTMPPEGDVCTALQLATLLDQFPSSVERADSALARMNANADRFFQRRENTVNDTLISKLFPMAEPDPYAHCLLTVFFLSFYYRADVADVAARHYELTAAAWPDLLWVAPHVNKEREEGCVARKIKLGVISGTLTEAHSVTEDFSGVLQRLDRDLFQVTYVYLKEDDREPATFLRAHPSDKVVVLEQDSITDVRNSAWVRSLGTQVAELELDMILYLDLTMSTHARRLGMERLAPVQINTHGHPMTSGHPRSTIQYFISWAEAELPLESAQTHYTEELLLIPHGKIHQVSRLLLLSLLVSTRFT
jgi:hypothetical protein